MHLLLLLGSAATCCYVLAGCWCVCFLSFPLSFRKPPKKNSTHHYIPTSDEGRPLSKGRALDTLPPSIPTPPTCPENLERVVVVRLVVVVLVLVVEAPPVRLLIVLGEIHLWFGCA